MQAAVTQMMMQVFLESENLKCGVVSTRLVDTFKQKEVQREVLAYMSKFLTGHSTDQSHCQILLSLHHHISIF